MHRGRDGACYNLGGGTHVTVNGVLHLLEEITGKKVRVNYQARQYGDALHTAADTTAARHELGFLPRFTLEDGLRMEVEWLSELLSVSQPA